MDEKSRISNGSFNSDLYLDYWESDKVNYMATDGVEYLGCAQIISGGYLSQNFLGDEEKQTVRFFAKGNGGVLNARIENADGDTLILKTYSLTSQWQEFSFEIGLYVGSFALRFEGSSATICLDEVYVSEIAVTRAKIAFVASKRLGEIATTLGYSTEHRVESGEILSEGDYTQEITDSMIESGFVNSKSQDDIRFVEIEDVPALIAKVTEKMMQKATNSLAMLTDIRVGNRSENLSQVVDNLSKLSSGSGKVGSSIRQIPISYS